MKQIIQAKYKDLKFKSEEEFNKWLNGKAHYQIIFEDKGQDFLNWYLDEKGEVLHSDLQAFVWNGKIVDTKKMKVGMQLPLRDGIIMNYKVEKIRILLGNKVLNIGIKKC